MSDESLSQGFAPSLDGSTPGMMPPPWATPDLDPGAASSQHGGAGQSSASFSKMLEDSDAMTMDTIDEMMEQQAQQNFAPNGNLPLAPPPQAGQLAYPAAGGAAVPTAPSSIGARNGAITGIDDGNAPPTVIDPLLWPPPNSSDPLGRPWANTWTGLQSVAPAEVTVPV